MNSCSCIFSEKDWDEVVTRCVNLNSTMPKICEKLNFYFRPSKYLYSQKRLKKLDIIFIQFWIKILNVSKCGYK
jgi:hypothetical protein